MLTIRIPVGDEVFDEETQTFSNSAYATLELEHSLVSLSKWEAFFEKPFLSQSELTNEQVLYYIECMTLTPNVPPEVFRNLTEENVSQINEYIQRKMTATTFRERPGPPNREILTAEVIQHMMIACNIPMEWGEVRHLNQLLTLIKVCGEKNKEPKKQSRAEIARQNRELNAARKAKLGTRG